MGVLGIFVGIEKPQPVHFARSTGHCYCCHCRGFVSFINLDSGHGDDIGTGEENNTGVSQPVCLPPDQQSEATDAKQTIQRQRNVLLL